MIINEAPEPAREGKNRFQGTSGVWIQPDQGGPEADRSPEQQIRTIH